MFSFMYIQCIILFSLCIIWIYTVTDHLQEAVHLGQPQDYHREHVLRRSLQGRLRHLLRSVRVNVISADNMFCAGPYRAAPTPAQVCDGSMSFLQITCSAQVTTGRLRHLLRSVMGQCHFCRSVTGLRLVFIK